MKCKDLLKSDLVGIWKGETRKDIFLRKKRRQMNRMEKQVRNMLCKWTKEQVSKKIDEIIEWLKSLEIEIPIPEADWVEEYGDKSVYDVLKEKLEELVKCVKEGE